VSSAEATKTTTADVLELRAVSKIYSRVKAVQEVSFKVPRGEFLCIIGPSGCGKTTLLRLIAGFVQPSSGEILIDGRSVGDVPPYHRPVNTVFQHYALFPHMTVAQNVGFGLEMRKVPRDEAARRIREMLALVGLTDYGPRPIQQLSGGEQQRVALARALVNNPAILLLDEPLGALDLKVRRRMQLELKRIHRDLGITFIHVTHDQEEALVMADRVAVMNMGRIEQVANTLEIYIRPQTRFVAEFVGESNSFQGKVTQRPEYGLCVEMAPGLCAGIPTGDGIEPGCVVEVYVRPEQVYVGPPPQSGMVNAFTGTVIDITFLGDRALYYVSLAEGIHIRASVPWGGSPSGSQPAIGDTVTVAWRRDAALVFAQ
jgi:spermidine/putrescine transport system ATP-binding protein